LALVVAGESMAAWRRRRRNLLVGFEKDCREGGVGVLVLLTTLGISGIGDHTNFAVNLVLDRSDGARRHVVLRVRHGDECESVFVMCSCVCIYIYIYGFSASKLEPETSTGKLGSVIPQKQT
jgi:hypothetical protein